MRLIPLLAAAACAANGGPGETVGGGASAADVPSVDAALRERLAAGLLPAPGGPVTPWGGDDPTAWRAEAVVANAASAAINRGWAEPALRDVLVAVPVQLIDSGFNPFGDGQTNSEIALGGWSARTPPLVAVLKIFDGGDVDVELTFAREHALSQRAVEIAYRPHDRPGEPFRSFIIDGDNDGGALSAVWTDPPDELDLAFAGQLTPLFVRPSPNHDDWYPIYFRLPRHTVDDFVGTVPESLRSFPVDRKPFADPERFADDGSGPTAIENARNRTTWTPGRYNVDNGLEPNGNPRPFEPPDVHGFVPGAPHRVNGATAVGKGFTWVAEQKTNLKLMYTGFEQRRVNLEAARGVPSGSGWHVVRDTLTLANGLERSPLLVGGGYTGPAVRFGIPLPSGAFAFGLDDVAVLRLLLPGEVFVSVPALAPDRDQDHQWYAIHTDHDFLAEEWVHPTRPAGDNPAF